VALEELHLDRRLRINPRDDAFAAGMMHDIGKVAMAVSYPGRVLAPEIRRLTEEWQQLA
jgi:response regulator RpfG family c-di-GMP phosphodiesterase